MVHDSTDMVNVLELSLLREALMDAKKYLEDEIKSFLSRGLICSLYTSSRPSVLSAEVILKHADWSQDSS